MRIVLVLSLLLFYFPLQAETVKIQYREQTITVQGNQYRARLPEGYTLQFIAGNMDSPRLFRFAPDGVLYIGSRSGNVYRLEPPYSRATVYIRLDDYPHSIAFRKNSLLIARTSGLYVAGYQAGVKQLSPEKLHLLAPLPGGGGHNSRTVAVGPDGRIYLGLGISGNCSDQYLGSSYTFQDRRGGVMVLDETGRKPAWKPFASGLRNPVGFDWHPETGEMYASNNGPDHHGYEQPPEYFSRLFEGSFHGMPWFQFDGKAIQRDDCIDSTPPRPMREVARPAVTFPARNAPMGVAFVPANTLSKRFENDAVVALHGSWGTRPGGGYWGSPASRRPPQLAIVRFNKGKAIRIDELVTGFQLQNGDRWARPIGVGFGPDGALYFTSDGGIHGLFKVSKMR